MLAQSITNVLHANFCFKIKKTMIILEIHDANEIHLWVIDNADSTAAIIFQK